jgi:hypothetical protein
MINVDTDKTYVFTTMNAYNKKYLLNPSKKIRELPQHMYASISLFLAIPE